MSEQPPEKKNPKIPRCRWRWLKRGILVSVLLLLIIGLLAWVFLPRIAERVIRQKMADAGLDQRELRVTDVGWRSAVVEDVSLGDGIWSMQVKRLEVDYDVSDLIKGTIKGIKLIDTKVVIDLLTEESKATPEVDEQEPVPAEVASKEYGYKSVADTLNQIGEVHAVGIDVLLKRDGVHWSSRVDLTIDDGGVSHPRVEVVTEDFELSAWLKTFPESAEWKFDAKVINPNKFLDLIELVINYEGELLPEGISLNGATLRHTMRAKEGEISPFEIDGLLSGVSYDGGEKPVGMTCEREVLMSLVVQASGSGAVMFFGKLDRVSMALDPSADFELMLKPDNHPDWEVCVEWGDAPTQISGGVKNMKLGGAYDARPVDLDDLKMDFQMVDGALMVEGELTNEGVKIPVKYSHTMDQAGEKWTMQGDLKLGPFSQDRNLPMLSAVVDVFDHVDVAGASVAKVDFSVGSHQPFQANMVAELTGAEIDVEKGKVKATGVNGVFKLHLIPLADDGLDPKDRSYYTFDFSAKKLSIDSKQALGFDLYHQIDKPVQIMGKGHLGMEDALLVGEVKGLTLHAEKEEHVLDLENMAFSFELKGDRLISSGAATIGGNHIPFFYQHDRRDVDGGWELDGSFQIKEADLKEPVDNAVMFVEAMAGNMLSGKVSIKMDFTLGSEKEFDGVLAATISEGALGLADDGPVIEGLKGGIRLESMKQKSTQGFQRVTATKVKAFDMEMQNLRLDYQLLANGDIKLRNMAVNALGGQVWLDDFTLPGGGENYKFKVRAEKLDVAQLAKLFPDFNGSISGSIDGLLPIENIKGEFRPGRGGMYLTPRSKGKLRYDAGNKFSAGIDPKSEEYKRMKMVEDSLRNLDLKVLSIRLFDPRDKEKALVIRLEGQATSIQGSPPIHLNINGFKPDDDTVDFFDLLLKHRDRLDFGL